MPSTHETGTGRAGHISHFRFPTTLLIASLLAALPLAGCSRSDPEAPLPEARRLCDEGTADLQAFRFGEAARKLGRCLDLDPSVAEAAIARAEAFANLRDNERALRELARADSLVATLHDDRRRMVAQLRLARSGRSRYSAWGDSLLERLSRQDPDNLYVLEAQANEATARGDIDEAVAIWERVLDVNPNHVAAYNRLGYLELARASYDAATAQFQKYIFLAPELANPHDSYGEVLLIRGRYEEAAGEFIAALEQQPDFYPSLINLARSHLARGHTAKGEAILDKVRQQVRGSDIERQVDLRILMAHLVADRRDRLATVSRDYVSRYPKDPMAPLLRCLLQAGQDRATEGFAIMDSTLVARRGTDHYRDDPRARVATEIFASQYEGLKRELLGEPAAAADAWAECIRLMDGNTPLHDQFFHRVRLADDLLQAGRPNDALGQLETILTVNPRQINALLLAVEAQLALGNRVDAEESLIRLEKALGTADPDYPPRLRAADLARQVRNPAEG